MDQPTRNKLRNAVTQCRKLLEEAVAQELQGRFGISAHARRDEVVIEDEARMTNLSTEEHSYRKDLIDHYEHIRASVPKAKDALAQLVREIAFTHLNRLCAYKMMEAREVYVGGQKFREAVSRGINSNGFKFYLADHPEDERLFRTGQQEVAYRHFLDWLGGLLSEEIGVLFSPNDPANRLYPPQRVLDQVIALLNGEDIKPEEAELREAWPNIWSEDEAIGWVYQYFTPKELRDQARKDSPAPRNSYELAFRNQFFTPRYVVEFLTDNTLGRIWYEMRKGDTKLTEQCRYLVRRPNEIYLAEGQDLPVETGQTRDDLSQEELLRLPVYIAHRPKKDPRDLKILDPACGSGHFLLYCFELLLTIYEEAWDDPDLGPALHREYPSLDDFRKAVPGLLLATNLHGIEIDLRCTQIAALALWLRCQRAFQDLRLKSDRPKITRSNIVCAEPMPGEDQLLKEFVGQLEPKLLGQLVVVVFEQMKLAGEAGSLLKIERAIRDAVAAAKKQWLAGPAVVQRSLFESDEPAAQQQQFDFSGIGDDEFFEHAEVKVIEALEHYAEKAGNGKHLQRRLFADDAMQGFAFVDICHRRFHVVLMNPPFGDFSLPSRDYGDSAYADCSRELYAAFIQRGVELLTPRGMLGAITSRTGFSLTTVEQWRRSTLLPTGIFVSAELGAGVLDTAMVETAAYVLGPLMRDSQDRESLFLRLAGDTTRSSLLFDAVMAIQHGVAPSSLHVVRPSIFQDIPGCPFAYWISPRLLSAFSEYPPLEGGLATVKVGLQTGDDFRFIRSFWEVPSHDITAAGGNRTQWVPHAKGGENAPFYSDIHLLVKWHGDGKEIREHPSSTIRNPQYFFKEGLTFPYRTFRFSPSVLPQGCITGVAGMGVFPRGVRPDALASLLNSGVFNEFISIWLERLDMDSLYQAGKIQPVPVPPLDGDAETALSTLATTQIRIRLAEDSLDETARCFVSPLRCVGTSLAEIGRAHNVEASRLRGDSIRIFRETEARVASLYRVGDEEMEIVLAKALVSYEQTLSSFTTTDKELVQRLVSYAVGCAVGRWDIRLCGHDWQVLSPADPCAPLQSCAPGMLTSVGSPPTITMPDNYPLRIDWDGILVDDPKHQDDIVRRASEVVEVIWCDRAASIEKEACEILGVKEIRDYFRRPGKGGFWDDHILRYSKSRRKAPIYWLLQSSKRSYAMWLYYHRFDKDMLFKALVNYVEPKIRLEDSRLNALRSQKTAAGESGKAPRALDREIERQVELLSELRDFEDKLRRAANLHLEPDLNDGVVLNIAPLHELVPWRVAKDYWEELLEGKYEWSSIGKQLRAKGLVKRT